MEIKELVSKEEIIAIPIVPRESRHYQTYNLDDAYEQGWNDLQECIENLPTVQPKHGKWISYSQFYPEVNTHWIKWECSECGYGRTKGWEGTTDGRCPEAKICENCGAIMEKGEQDEFK